MDDSKMCPLAMCYDADIHDALANLRKLDGSIPVHDKYFAQKGKRKYWAKPSTPELGYILNLVVIIMIIVIIDIIDVIDVIGLVYLMHHSDCLQRALSPRKCIF